MCHVDWVTTGLDNDHVERVGSWAKIEATIAGRDRFPLSSPFVEVWQKG